MSKPSAKVIIRRMVHLKKRTHPDFFELWGKLREMLYETPEYQNFLLVVRARSAYMCASGKCSKRGRHVHHVVRVYDDPTKSVDPENGLFLCVKCHKAQHPQTKPSAKREKKRNGLSKSAQS